ncbi:hypothetical protein DAPPUDRAFT_317997 [Daphnia pulex]|uniref:Inactive serine protease scarface clip-domain domain-containing protein n=1 Tax=Daphnia pulex TaxID=6669 RepID=E9GHJ7_DAPPU|nr:hypothetical protein DAPPUDRAFT_317997 [Daphnia pulex]|eukprot:EFX80856.1 hypothetical protein DAPPUDRAFT_317997 [Daphnia pulex]
MLCLRAMKVPGHEDYEKEYLRVPLMKCTNPETNQFGFCCLDPLREDPWPSGMPMPE